MAGSLERKPTGSVEDFNLGDYSIERINDDALGGTSHDAQDMYRMGKQQELRVSLDLNLVSKVH